MPKGVPNKHYTPGFKVLVVETMQKEKLSYSETARQFEVNDHHRIQVWERTYMTEVQEGFSVERRGRGSKGRPAKLPPKEEDLLAEIQRLRAENAYLNLKIKLTNILLQESIIPSASRLTNFRDGTCQPFHRW